MWLDGNLCLTTCEHLQPNIILNLVNKWWTWKLTLRARLRAGLNTKNLAQHDCLVLSNSAQLLYIKVGPKHSLIPCGVLSGTSLASNLRTNLMKLGRVFPLPEFLTWIELGSFVGYEHFYHLSRTCQFSSLHFPLKSSRPKIGPHHFTFKKIGPN